MAALSRRGQCTAPEGRKRTSPSRGENAVNHAAARGGDWRQAARPVAESGSSLTAFRPRAGEAIFFNDATRVPCRATGPHLKPSPLQAKRLRRMRSSLSGCVRLPGSAERIDREKRKMIAKPVGGRLRFREVTLASINVTIIDSETHEDTQNYCSDTVDLA